VHEASAAPDSVGSASRLHGRCGVFR
jgi:hypothetical protein